MSAQQQAARSEGAESLIFRATHSHKGRHIAVTPANSSMRHLAYGRIRLDSATPRAEFDTEGREHALVCLSGTCAVAVGGEAHTLSRYDAIYIPRGAGVEVTTETEVDLVECSAEVEGEYEVQVVRYEDARKDSSLVFETGTDSARRKINVLVGKNVEAGRLLVGVTESQPGNWTSFPPHEHAEMLEELYVFYDMPPPAFGIQFVYTNTEQPEGVYVVREGDCVLMPAGYHPNVSIPGHPINFVWMMAAHKEVEHRQYGVVNVQPEFAGEGSGLEQSHR